MKRPIKLLFITVIFIILVGYDFYLLFYPYKIYNSLTLSRFWILCWILLEGIVLAGLIFFASWTIKALYASYTMNMVSAVFCGNLTGLLLLMFIWTLIYIPVIKYIKKPEICILFDPSSKNK